MLLLRVWSPSQHSHNGEQMARHSGGLGRGKRGNPGNSIKLFRSFFLFFFFLYFFVFLRLVISDAMCCARDINGEDKAG